MNNSKNSINVVNSYFNAFGEGDIETIINTFHEDSLIVSVKDIFRLKKAHLHGTYNGSAEARQFIANIGSLFNTKDFTVKRIVAEGNVVFANGSFTHEVKRTGKLFESDWTQMCIIEGNKIKEYRFYEDSAAYVEADTL